MKITRYALALALVIPAFISLGAVETVLTPAGTLFAIDESAEAPKLELLSRVGDVSVKVAVPGTENEAVESDAHLAFDAEQSTLYVVWHSRSEHRDEIRVSSLSQDGIWSGPKVISDEPLATHEGLQVVLTHAGAEHARVTLLHVVWWKKMDIEVAEYALAAFEEGDLVSTDVSSLHEIAGTIGAASDDESSPVTVPPLTMSRHLSGAEVVFGSVGSAALTRVRLTPGKVAGNARIWKPIGRTGSRLPHAELLSMSADPVSAFLSNGRVVLYAAEHEFRFVVFEDGKWTPTRTIKLDETLSGEQMTRELRRAMALEAVIDEAPSVQ